MTRVRTWLLGCVVTAAVVAVAAYWLVPGRAAGLPRLVLLYAPCTVNRSYLSPYNPAVSYTPFLEDFARQSIVFTKHHTEEGRSGIAYASLFSGNQAMRHGVYRNATAINDSMYLIAEAYRDNGYETFFWADHVMASPELNFGQGVSAENTISTKSKVWPPPKEGFLLANDARFTAILEHLHRDRSYRAFVLTNFTVTHGPYRGDHVVAFCRAHPRECAGLTEEELQHYGDLFSSNALGWSHDLDGTAASLNVTPDQLAKVARAAELLYMSNINYLDELFGALIQQIEAAGLLDESLIAFTADHGEAMLHRRGSPLRWTHGYMLGSEDIVVPLIVRARTLTPGRFDSVTRSIDVFPTLAGLSGIDLPADTTMGVDLAPALTGKAPPPTLLAFSHTSLAAPAEFNRLFPITTIPFIRQDPGSMWVAVREGDLVYKLTSEDGSHFQPHVYNWESDPGETTDLYDPQDAQHAAMVKRLAQYKAALVEGYLHSKAVADGRVPSERQEEILRSLGYAD